MSQPDWGRLSAQVDRRTRRDRTQGEVILRGHTVQGRVEAPKTPNEYQESIPPVPSRVAPLPMLYGHSAQVSTMLDEWRTVTGRIERADRWFADNAERDDPIRYGQNVNLYCTLMARSAELGRELLAAGVTCDEVRA